MTRFRSGLRRIRPLAAAVPLLAALAALLSLPGPPAGAEQSAAMHLAEKYAPLMMLRVQSAACDPEGEPFLPAPVEVTFDPRVLFHRESAPPQQGLEMADLYEAEAGDYIDLPGQARAAGCLYEQDFKEVMGERRPVVYAHVATEEGKPGLALQYWFFFWFNDYNNVHEGDWEGIQLLFDASTAEEALAQDPVEVAYSQHEGGESADWNSQKFEQVDGRPVVYTSRGSHASYFGPAVWIGWGRDGSGLGCDVTTGPSFQIDPEVRLLPTTVDSPGDPAAWVAYAGRWGERGDSFFNGPTGPPMKTRWTNPVTWQESLRASSIPLRAGPALGPAATGVYCDLIEDLSALYILSSPHPWLVALALAIVAGLAWVTASRAWPALRQAWTLYRMHPRGFISIAATLVPFTLVATGLLYLANDYTGPTGIIPLDEDKPALAAIVQLLVTGSTLLLALVAGPAMIWMARELEAGRRPPARDALRTALRAAPRTALTQLLVFLATGLLLLTIVGIPVAAYMFVRWIFASQAVILDGAKGREAMRLSAEATKGAWLRTALSLPTLTFAGAALAPVIGIVLMVLLDLPLDITNGIGSLVYLLSQPLAYIALTIMYLGGRRQPEPAA
ncbi:MAG: glycerophosphoryl diester phosphodiesterase membrane domain-containing protein [Chloroflexota bacterium]